MAQTLEQQIRKVIRQHYGEDLWSFREDVGYKNATKSFVTAIAKSLRGEIVYATDFPDEVAKYSKGGSAERAAGAAVRKLRIKKDITLEQLAANVGVHPEFLDALESGRLAAGVNLYVDAYYALKPTQKEVKAFGDSIDNCRTQEAAIRDVIETHYGLSLWALRPEVSYEEAIHPFVKSLSALIKV